MEKISDRLLKIIENEMISTRAFEVKSGISNGALSKSIRMGTDISNKSLTKIIDAFPKYSPSWILTGEGEMLNLKNDNKGNLNESSEHYGNKGKPYPVKNGPADPPVPCAECIHKDNLIKELRRNILLMEENADLLRQLLNEKRAK